MEHNPLVVYPTRTGAPERGREYIKQADRTDFTPESLMEPGGIGRAQAAIRFGTPEARRSADAAMRQLRSARNQLRRQAEEHTAAANDGSAGEQE